MRAAILALLVLGSTAAAAAQQHASACHKPCREHPQLEGRCFSIRGRMSVSNGAPSVRIWRVGTKRLLGVSEQRFYIEGYCNLPDSIRNRLSWDADLFADFVVCPFTRQAPGVMQLICVDSATNMVTRSRPAGSPVTHAKGTVWSRLFGFIDTPPRELTTYVLRL